MFCVSVFKSVLGFTRIRKTVAVYTNNRHTHAHTRTHNTSHCTPMPWNDRHIELIFFFPPITRRQTADNKHTLVQHACTEEPRNRVCAFNSLPYNIRLCGRATIVRTLLTFYVYTRACMQGRSPTLTRLMFCIHFTPQYTVRVFFFLFIFILIVNTGQ